MAEEVEMRDFVSGPQMGPLSAGSTEARCYVYIFCILFSFSRQMLDAYYLVLLANS